MGKTFENPSAAKEKQLSPIELGLQQFFKENNFAGASESGREALKLNPDDQVAKNLIESSQKILDKKQTDLLGKITGAVAEEVREAIKSKGQNSPAEFAAKRGLDQYFRNDFVGAIASWGAILKLEPGNERIQNCISLAQDLLDMKKDLFLQLNSPVAKETPDALQALFEQIEPTEKK
ncbi:MAG: hypothetical protein WCV72_03290 [Patescibacteria group bacterium]|jgi:hypothetical protein